MSYVLFGLISPNEDLSRTDRKILSVNVSWRVYLENFISAIQIRYSLPEQQDSCRNELFYRERKTQVETIYVV